MNTPTWEELTTNIETWLESEHSPGMTQAQSIYYTVMESSDYNNYCNNQELYEEQAYNKWLDKVNV